MYDVCIIGAGPAGSTLARLIGDRYRVLIVDARTFETPDDGRRGKPCGGLLAPKAQRELALQGLGLPESVVSGPQLFAVRAFDLQTHLERTYQRHYLNLDREQFDRWLLSLMPPSVDTAFGYRAVSIETDADGSLVRLEGRSGARASVVARYVVGADGARSIVRAGAFADRPRPEAYVAFQATLDALPGAPYYGAIFSSAHTDYYGWTIPKEHGTLVGLALPRTGGTRQRFDGFLSSVRAAGLVTGPEIAREATTVLRPARPSELLCGGPGIALVGEAAGFLSPSSAEGLSYALRSGRLLARALEAGIDRATERYRAETLALRADIVSRFAKSAAIYTPAMRYALMRSGIRSLRIQEPGLAKVRPQELLG